MARNQCNYDEFLSNRGFLLPAESREQREWLAQHDEGRCG